MEPADLTDIIRRVEGRWQGAERPPSLRVAELVTDSRTLRGQGVFVALSGAERDGHSYVEEARRRGAVASIVSEAKLRDLPATGGPYIAVDDPLTALERLARWNREALGFTVVGVTGSVGKTSTKEFLGTVLGGRFRVKTAPKSFNNRLGVALTLLSAGARTEVLVVELATSAPGELSHLSRLVRPERVVVTEIAPAHLEGLGDLDGVVLAKAEVFEGLAPGGSAFLRHGVYGFERFRRCLERPPVTFGWGEGTFAVSRCERVSLGGEDADDGATAYGYHFTVNHEQNFLLPVPGRHNVLNAAAAIAVARDFEMSWEEIRATLAQCRLLPLRLQVVQDGGVVLYDDSYNANPSSMEAAIDEWLSHRRERHRDGENGAPGCRHSRSGNGSGRLVAVLGDMRELGRESRRLHEGIGSRLARTDTRILITVGEDSRWIGEAYRRDGGSGESVHFESAAAVLGHLQLTVRPGDRVLFKGSRAVALDHVVAGLRAWLRNRQASTEASTE
jgi:UDP-N-acetylmuramoyl-tripeptide--D-alanyl-D-alanine ligase